MDNYSHIVHSCPLVNIIYYQPKNFETLYFECKKLLVLQQNVFSLNKIFRDSESHLKVLLNNFKEKSKRLNILFFYKIQKCFKILISFSTVNTD